MTILLFVTVLIACNNNDESNQNLDGNYTGIFTVEFPDGRIYTNSVTVNFSEKNNYESSGDGNHQNYYPSGGNGTYEIGEAKIKFLDENIWLANFDTHLVLGGEYEFIEDENDKIIFSKENKIGVYKYEITKD